MKERDPELVTAAEIAAWAYCPEAWRLDALGAEPENQAARDGGEAAHARKAALEKGSRSVTFVGWRLVAAAAALLVAALAYALVRG